MPPARSAPRQVAIAFGSNLGDRLAHLRAGREAVVRWHETASPVACSPLYETEPVDCPAGSAPFLNAVLEIETALAPADLLAECRKVELALGRAAAAARHAPRPLDLDILYAGEATISTPELTIPHPRLSARRFVLRPLADLRPSLVLPGHPAAVAQLLDALPPRPAVALYAAEW